MIDMGKEIDADEYVAQWLHCFGETAPVLTFEASDEDGVVINLV